MVGILIHTMPACQGGVYLDTLVFMSKSNSQWHPVRQRTRCFCFGASGVSDEYTASLRKYHCFSAPTLKGVSRQRVHPHLSPSEPLRGSAQLGRASSREGSTSRVRPTSLNRKTTSSNCITAPSQHPRAEHGAHTQTRRCVALG